MSRKLTSELVESISQSKKTVRHGLWRHRASSVLYIVQRERVLNEPSVTPLILYRRVGDPRKIVWARDETAFLSSFAKESGGNFKH